MFYWTLAWTLSNDSITFRSWGIQFALAIIQDVCISQPVKVFVIHVAIIQVIRTQLRQIFNVLQSLAVTTFDERFEGEEAHDLPDLRVVQFLSATCRAARTVGTSQIPAARVLMKLGDYEYSLCREGRNVRLSVILASVILLPSLLAFADTRIQEVIIDISLRSAWNGFLLLNAALLKISPGILVLPYIAVFAYLIFNARKWYRIHHRRRRDTALASNKLKKRMFKRDSNVNNTSLAHIYAGESTRNGLQVSNQRKVNRKLPWPGIQERQTLVARLAADITGIKSSYKTYQGSKFEVRLTSEELLWRNINLSVQSQAHPRCTTNYFTTQTKRPALVRDRSDRSHDTLGESGLDGALTFDKSMDEALQKRTFDRKLSEASKPRMLMKTKSHKQQIGESLTWALTRMQSAHSLRPIPSPAPSARHHLGEGETSADSLQLVTGSNATDRAPKKMSNDVPLSTTGALRNREIHGENRKVSAKVRINNIIKSTSFMSTPFVDNWRHERALRLADDLYMSAKESFQKLDTDNDGALSGEDMEAFALWAWNTFDTTDTTPTKLELDEVLDRYLCLLNPEATGVISFDQFLSWFRDVSDNMIDLADRYENDSDLCDIPSEQKRQHVLISEDGTLYI